MADVDDTGRGSEPDDVLGGVAGRVGDVVIPGRIFGEPIERDGVTVIPVARAVFGFGGGSGPPGSRREKGRGGGGGGVVLPVGYIELRGGASRFRPIVDPILVVPIAFAALRVLSRSLRRHQRRHG